MTTQIAEIQVRRGTAAAWTAANTVLADGEWGKESDTGKMKLGDGLTQWVSLPYILPVDTSALAPLASPALTGNPTAPTQTTADSSTKVATTAFVHAAAPASTLAGATDVLIASPTDGQVLTYVGAASKWENRAGGGSGGSVTLATIAAAMPYAVDLPENHGAVRNGSTNDTAAIQAAINAVVAAGQANGSNYGEVWFSSGIYQLTSAVGGHGAPTFANSQLTLPVITSGSTSQKFTLVLRGTSAASALPHWNQTVGQKNGAVLRSTATGTADVVYGTASIVGGPTLQQGYGGGSANAWSNMLVVVDGITVMSSTANPTMSGFNFEGLLEAKIGSASYIVDAQPSTMLGFITSPATFTNTFTFGLKMPTTNNNDLCMVQDWSCEGAWYGIIMGEHTHILDMRAVYCGWGIELDNSVGTPHISRVEHASIEVCQNIMGLIASSGTFKIDGNIDVEQVGFIWDGNSLIQGEIRLGSNIVPAKGTTAGNVAATYIGLWSSSPTNGSQMRLINRDTLPGAVAVAPAVPGASTDAWNMFMRDAAISVSAGTSVAISVDGVATGLTGGTVIVPAGKKYNLGAYTGSPVVKWVLL